MTITAGRHAAPPFNGHTLAPFTIQTLGPVSALPRQRRWHAPDGDTIIRVLAAVVVLAVAAFAAIVSYAHIFELGRLHGQDGTAGRLLPLSVDGLIASASLVMLYAARNDIGLRRLSWPRVMLWLGIGATVAANVLYGLPFGWLAAVVSAWPAVAFVGSVEMAVRFARDTRDGDTPAPAVTPDVTPPVTPVTPVRAKPRPAAVKPGLSVAAEAVAAGVTERTIKRRRARARQAAADRSTT